MYENFSSSRGMTPDDALLLPTDIFASPLSPLEAVVKYLKEEHHKTYTEISTLLGRQTTTISTTYYNAQKKHPEALVGTSPVTVPVTVLAHETLTVAESVAYYLHVNKELSIKSIATLLSKDNKALWTTISRAKKKQQGPLQEHIAIEESLPLSTLATTLSPLEAVVVALKEQGKTYRDIARVLKRKETTISSTYYNACKKEQREVAENNELVVPLSILGDEQLSILEAIVHYFSTQGYKLSTLARIMGKDNKALWTCKQRAAKKKQEVAT